MWWSNTNSPVFFKRSIQKLRCPVNFSKFAAQRPRSVKTMGSNLFNNCLCEYYTNVEMKEKAINQKNQKSPVLSRYDFSKLSLCKKNPEKSKFHKKKCVERNCIESWYMYVSGKKLVEWNKWQTQAYNYQGTRKSRKVLQLKKGSVEVFIKELRAEIEVLVHIYTMLIGIMINFCTSQRLFHRIGQSCVWTLQKTTRVFIRMRHEVHIGLMNRSPFSLLLLTFDAKLAMR